MRKLGCITLLLFFNVLNCVADEPALQQGTWPGSLALPGKDEVSARVNVRTEVNTDAKSTTKITMYVEETPLEFIDLKIRKNTLKFSIDTGKLNECVMTRNEDGSYAGYCETADTKDKQGRITLTMRPPKSEAEDTQPDSAEDKKTE